MVFGSSILVAKSAKRSTKPTTVNGTVPRRVPNRERRPCEYLTPEEVARLMESARDCRHL